MLCTECDPWASFGILATSGRASAALSTSNRTELKIPCCFHRDIPNIELVRKLSNDVEFHAMTAIGNLASRCVLAGLNLRKGPSTFIAHVQVNTTYCRHRRDLRSHVACSGPRKRSPIGGRQQAGIFSRLRSNADRLLKKRIRRNNGSLVPGHPCRTAEAR
jgi:hypothetical protein